MTDENARVVTPYEGTGHREWDSQAPVETPLRLHHTPVRSSWVDYNGHMSESCYLLVFGDNADAFFRFLGIGEEYRAAGHSLYTVETHIHNRREAREGDPLDLTIGVLDHDGKRVHIFHEMRHGDSGEVLASAEQLLVHVDMRAGKSAPLPDYLNERLEQVRAAHAGLEVPAYVGRPIQIHHD